MDRLAYTLVTMALFLSADSSGALRAPVPNDFRNLASVDNAAAPLGSSQSDNQPPSKKSKAADAPDSTDSPSAKGPDGTLQPMSRLSLVRFVDGEIVQVV